MAINGYGTGPKPKEEKGRIRAAHLIDGEETLEAKAEHRAKSLMFRHSNDIGNHLELFYKNFRPKANPPSVYAKPGLADPEQLAFAILKTLPTT